MESLPCEKGQQTGVVAAQSETGANQKVELQQAGRLAGHVPNLSRRQLSSEAALRVGGKDDALAACTRPPCPPGRRPSHRPREGQACPPGRL